MLVVNSSNFATEVLSGVGTILVLWGMALDLNTSRIAKQMEALDPKKVKICRIDVDENPSLAMKYTIRDVPFLMLVKDGSVVATGTSLSPELLKLLES